MSNYTTNSDLDRHAEDEVNEAEAVLQKYVDTTRDCVPIRPFSMDRFIESKCVQVGFDPGAPKDRQLVTRKVQNTIKERCSHTLTRSGRVYIDLAGAVPEKVGWLTNHPHIAFGALTSKDVALAKFLGSEDIEVIAVYFDPQLAKSSNRRDNRTGEWLTIPDQFDPNGYVQIVRTFESMVEAMEAKDELQRAITRIADEAKSAYTDDPVQSEGVPEWVPPQKPDLDSL